MDKKKAKKILGVSCVALGTAFIGLNIVVKYLCSGCSDVCCVIFYSRIIQNDTFYIEGILFH